MRQRSFVFLVLVVVPVGGVSTRCWISHLGDDPIQSRAGAHGGIGLGFIGLIIAAEVNGLALDGDQFGDNEFENIRETESDDWVASSWTQ